MCLYKAIPCDGNDEIIGYKVLARNGDGEFTSIVDRNYVYKIGEEYMNYPEGELDYTYGTAHKGALFMFKEKKDAVFYMNNVCRYKTVVRHSDLFVVECKIPKNTDNVLIGTQELFNTQCGYYGDAVGYASPRLTITKVLF